MAKRGSNEETQGELGKALRAFECAAYQEAFDAFSRLEREGDIPTEARETFAVCAELLGKEGEYLRLFEHCYGEHLANGHLIEAARCAFFLGFRMMALGEFAKANAWLKRCEHLVDENEPDGVLRGYLLLPAARRELAQQNRAEGAKLARRAIEIGQSYGESDLVALARTIQGLALISDDELDRGLALFDEAMLSATSDELSPIFAGLVYCTVISACQSVHDYARAREWTAELTNWCDGQPDLVTFRGECCVHRAEIEELSGRWGGALEQALRASALSKTPALRSTNASGHYRSAEIHRLRGDFEAAEGAYTRASELGCDVQPGLALLRLRQGQIEAAAGGIHRALIEIADPMRRTRLLSAAVEVYLAAERWEDAESACAELGKRAEIHPLDALVAESTEARGRLHLARGKPESALGPLRKSFYYWQRLGIPYREARVRTLLARACSVLGDAEGAEQLLEQARAIFENLGAGPDAKSLGELSAPSPRSRGGARELSEREREVLRRVVHGDTNRKIAADLGLSEKTVDRHVSNIFVKMGVSSRTAAAAQALKKSLI